MNLLLSALTSVVASAIIGSATVLPRGIPILDEYLPLYNLCESRGPKSYVGVHYADGTNVTYNFDECYPYELSNGVLAEQAVWCKSSTCFNNPNPDCTGGAVPPVPVPVPQFTVLVNAADFVQFIGQGATCQENVLSGV